MDKYEKMFYRLKYLIETKQNLEFLIGKVEMMDEVEIHCRYGDVHESVVMIDFGDFLNILQILYSYFNIEMNDWIKE